MPGFQKQNQGASPTDGSETSRGSASEDLPIASKAPTVNCELARTGAVGRDLRRNNRFVASSPKAGRAGTNPAGAASTERPAATNAPQKPA
jgi:hypothetical protein